ncbi:HvfC family RiPP maturation protein [Alteromonas lipolytica]|uniref:Uncharacterized protein n=1 Tax=Alteromonas lipolytica TaxID=1856405 RepID=A0A1E8FEQ6_9ALTE|nr:putative DNA-binding domain-containing protein [Alteromonas lipolytica]OFI34415.1 hypothetical protein BFC17_18740 [Alteromonas lipolytica]GGF81644.1 DUF2063 domain-containing protein [Alteromonas lipolytica]
MSLESQLTAFANSIRQPASAAKESPDTRRRMAIYRSLFFNNVSGFIQSGFPVLHSLYSEEKWQKLVRHFFTGHQCSSPYFIDISKEFVEFLSNEYHSEPDDPVFLAELAHYEWLELALSVREAGSYTPWQESGMPVLMSASPLSEVAAYHYPVHLISPEFQPHQSEAMHYYLLYRDPQHQVQFQHITALSAMAMELLGKQAYSFDKLVETIHQLAPQFSCDVLQQGLAPLIDQWLSCGAVVDATSS